MDVLSDVLRHLPVRGRVTVELGLDAPGVRGPVEATPLPPTVGARRGGGSSASTSLIGVGSMSAPCWLAGRKPRRSRLSTKFTSIRVSFGP